MSASLLILDSNATADRPATRMRLYREWQAEREEILRHKWLESEKAGRDIGFENAMVNWVIYHRAHWRKARAQHRAAESIVLPALANA